MQLLATTCLMKSTVIRFVITFFVCVPGSQTGKMYFLSFLSTFELWKLPSSWRCHQFSTSRAWWNNRCCSDAVQIFGTARLHAWRTQCFISLSQFFWGCLCYKQYFCHFFLLLRIACNRAESEREYSTIPNNKKAFLIFTSQTDSG